MSGGRAGSAKGLLERNGITAHNAGAWQNVSYNQNLFVPVRDFRLQAYFTIE